MRFAFLLVNLAAVLCNLVGHPINDAPNFVSGCGLTVLNVTQLNTQLYEVVVSSEQVRGDQKIRILVPTDYTTSGASRRYPVLYLLHGAFGGDADWTGGGAAQSTTSNAPLISVMPNGDPFGFYTNWVIPQDVAPQNWRTYHMEQLVPWIDLNLRTVAKKGGRAIAGLSMGGFGAIHYAERYSDNFVYGASFSGAVDLLDTTVQNIIIGLPGRDKPLIGPFGYPNASRSSNGWVAEDTVTHTSDFHNISIAIYTGAVGGLELALRNGSYRLRDSLESLKIPVYFDDYGNGQSIGYGCDGAHSWPCWKAALINVLPRMMAVLEQQH
jgi:S-formylglutathione hydrolase FrmB